MHAPGRQPSPGVPKVNFHQTQLKVLAQTTQQESLSVTDTGLLVLMAGGAETIVGTLTWSEGAQKAGTLVGV